ncbi:aldehyde dehydrogenase family protein [Noviherbaspirillum sedimenti]|uniref:Aldehyde dehydrogenase family protein n=2 Tax=Noviherbaspirillum sedimenti TaxID=2320865 RepID=A0A3A3GBG3_9BURK|nr:aldehyde dehydrogenase family protein [Noviherbaspirillum sedimenti]
MELHPNLDPAKLALELSGKHLIDGVFCAAASGRNFDVVNPATGKKIGEAADGNVEDVDRAVKAAVTAQRAWGKVNARDRGKILSDAARKLSDHAEELALLVALESGKALRTESRPEGNATADVFNFFAGLASELKGETVPLKSTALTYTVREPVGVVAAIIPWNAPMLLMAFKIAPALVAGNAVVVKSAEETPLAVLRVIQILNAFLPPGLLSIVSGDGPGCGGPLVAHPAVRKVTFTGSVETGKIIYRAAAEKIINVTLELGGKSAMIVMADADLEQAVEGAVSGMRFTRQGQSCTAASRMLVHASLHDVFVEKLKARVNALKMGDPLDEKTDIGTVISRPQYAKILSYIASGKAEKGAVAHICAAMPTDSKLAEGLFIQPVIFTGVPTTSRLIREEIFGPVTCVIPFSDVEEAIRIANDSDFGLAATVWTKDLKIALNAANTLEAGLVQINQNQVAGPNISYGGVKLSGVGKELSLESMLEHFTHKKTVIVNLE